MLSLQDITNVKRWYILHLCLCITFFVSSITINIMQFVLYVTVRPINKKLFQKINYYLIYSITSQILFVAEWWSGSDVNIFTDDEGFKVWGKEHALLISNHTFEVDWLIGYMVAERSQALGAAKVFMKKVIKCVPTIGWMWSVSDIIFVDRDWQKDKEHIRNMVKELCHYPYAVWLLIFCEGTRFTPSKHAASMEVAKQKNLPLLKHHLLPRTKGFLLSVETIRGHFDAIYDITLTFNTKDGAEPTLLNMLKGEKVIAEMYMRRIELSTVPQDEAGAVNFLHNLYQEKDDLVDSYINTGSFTKENNHPAYKLRKMPRRIWSLVNSISWGVIVLSLTFYYVYQLLMTGSWIANLVVLSVFLTASIGLKKIIGLTKIEKGSEYGVDTNKTN